nr:hypothetical protein [Brucella sp. 09RB8910]
MAHEAVFRLKPGDRLAAGELVGHMGDMHENGGWTPHLHFQISTDTGLSATEILGVGESAYLDVWGDIFPDAAPLAGIPAEAFQQSGRTRAEIISARKEMLLPNLSISYSDPIKFRARRWRLADRQSGRAYLDCFNNVCHLGHAHRKWWRRLPGRRRSSTPIRAICMILLFPMERLTATLPEG